MVFIMPLCGHGAVQGMANYNKNMFIGIGGREAINLSHFIGAVYGMERMMGIADNPLRRILNYASDHFVTGRIPVVYILTVIGAPTALQLCLGLQDRRILSLSFQPETRKRVTSWNCVLSLTRVASCVRGRVVGESRPGQPR